MINPVRHKNIPKEAVWNSDYNEWCLGKYSKEGNKEGIWKFYRPDGIMCEEAIYEDGLILNYKRFYENGELAEEGNVKSFKGKILSQNKNGIVTWYRGSSITEGDRKSETFAKTNLNEKIFVLKNRFELPYITGIWFFDEQGNMVTKSGDYRPERPSNVMDGSIYVPEAKQWNLISTIQGTSIKEGVFKWWDENGVFFVEKEYLQNKCLRTTWFYENGNKKTEEIYFSEKDGFTNLKEEQIKLKRRFFESGQKKWEYEFNEHEKVVINRYFYKTGKIERLVNKRDQFNKIIWYYEDGKIFAEGIETNNDSDVLTSRIFKIYDENGDLILESNIAPLMGNPKNKEQLLKYVKAFDEINRISIPSELEGINEIDWENVKCCWSEYSRFFPLYLTGMTSNDSNTFNVAYSELLHQIIHQGTIYEGTAKVIPFFLKLLGKKDFSRKLSIIEDLPRLASGTSYLDIHQHLCLMSYERNKPDFKEKLQKELDEVAATHFNIANGFIVYADLLKESNRDIRRWAAITIASAPIDNIKSVNTLIEALKKEKDVLTICDMIISLSLLIEYSDDRKVVLYPFLQNKDLLIRFVTALSLLRIEKDEVSEEVLNIIVEVVKDPSKLENQYDKLFLTHYELVSELASTLTYFNPKKSLQLISRFIELIGSLNPLSALNVLNALVFLVFKEKKFAKTRLSENQKEVIRCIAENDNLWRFNVNLFEIIRPYDIPTNREELKSLFDQ